MTMRLVILLAAVNAAGWGGCHASMKFAAVASKFWAYDPARLVWAL